MRSTSWDAPRAAFRSVSACSKRWPATSSTTSPYIWMSRRYESSANRAFPRGRRQTLDRDVVQAEVEDRVHHPRHRDRRAGADGDEQRVAIVAEALACTRLECRDALVDLLVEPGRNVSAGGEIGAARLGGDREPVRNGHAESGHLGEADPLPPEELTAAARALGEVEDVAHLRGESTGTRRGAETRMVMRLPRSYTSSNLVLVCHGCDIRTIASAGNPPALRRSR